MKLKRREKKVEVKRRKTRKVVLMKKCWMCNYFRLADRMNREERRCRPAGKRVASDDKGCEKLIATSTFYCNKRHCYMSTVACISIREKKRLGNGNDWMSPGQYRKVYSECYEKCTQGRAMEWAVRQCGIAEKTEPEERKPKLKRRVKGESKLKRRKGR